MNSFKYATELPIKLDIDTVQTFVNLTKDVPFDIDLRSEGRLQVIDAKSIMGIFSLDLSIPHILCTNAVGPEVDTYKKTIEKFLC